MHVWLHCSRARALALICPNPNLSGHMVGGGGGVNLPDCDSCTFEAGEINLDDFLLFASTVIPSGLFYPGWWVRDVLEAKRSSLIPNDSHVSKMPQSNLFSAYFPLDGLIFQPWPGIISFEASLSGFCSYFQLTCSQKRRIPAPALNLIGPFSKRSRRPRRGMLQTISPRFASSPAASADTMMQR